MTTSATAYTTIVTSPTPALASLPVSIADTSRLCCARSARSATERATK